MSRRIVMMFVCCLLSAVCCLARNGAYKSTRHAGLCLQCHDQQQRIEDVCLRCHTPLLPQSAHALANCGDCHDPHGVRDRDGVIPSLLAARQRDVCTTCHDGSRAADVRSQLNKPYVHGTLTRHADCSDCHAVHADPANPRAGVARVQVVNGAAGTVPGYRLAAPNDPGDAQELEICFKCHSSYVKQPLGQSDLARLTNPANPSFHPIQAAGKNPRLDPQSFVNGIAADSLVTCSDCHEPHGSTDRYLLKKSQDEICFQCHARETYRNGAPGSRFDGHALHAGIQRIACFTCHESHGSIRNAALIATGRFPGMTTYTQSPMGGTCISSCHALKTYSVSYPR